MHKLPGPVQVNKENLPDNKILPDEIKQVGCNSNVEWMFTKKGSTKHVPRL